VTLQGASVVSSSYAFRGGVFGSADATQANDFVFAPAAAGSDRAATFAVTEPVPDAFEPSAVFPHAENLLEGAQMSLGESRWAFFVRSAHFGREAPATPDELAEPAFAAAVFDESVFEPGTEAAAAVGFDWQEHEPFAATLWIPARFAALDADGEVPVRERVRLFLDRYRGTGIHVYAKYEDDEWSLGSGLLRDLGATDPRGTVVVGTRLWPDDAVQPPPS
jgi:hypothetical protein